MSSVQSRYKPKKTTRASRNTKSIRNKNTQDIPSKFNIKLFIALGLLLIILLMKKYDLSIGKFDVDRIYDVVYHNEDLEAIKDKIFFFDKDNKVAEETDNQTIDETSNDDVEVISNDDLTDKPNTEDTTNNTDTEDTTNNTDTEDTTNNTDTTNE